MVDKGRGGAVELRCEFGSRGPVAHFWVAVAPEALGVVDLDEARRRVDDGRAEVLLGTAFVAAAGDGLFDVTISREVLRGADELATQRLGADGVRDALAHAPWWRGYEGEAGKVSERSTLTGYARDVALAKRALTAAVREAGGGRHVFPWLHRDADGGLRAHLVVEDLNVAAFGVRTMRAVAARYGAELVTCPGCTSETPYLVQTGTLARVGLGELEGPVEKQLRERMLPPF
jgi:hypothetical protein